MISSDGNRWTMTFMADSYGHAESQAIDALIQHNDIMFNQIIKIEREWDRALIIMSVARDK